MLKGVVFDLDHTLFDRYATLRRIVPFFCREWAGRYNPALSEEAVCEAILRNDKTYVHLDWEVQVQKLAEEGFFTAVPDWREYRDYFRSYFMHIAEPYDFTIPTLQTLRDMGLKVALITNGRTELQQAKLDMLGLNPYFDSVIISGSFGIDKPDLTPFLTMAEWLEAEPGQLIYAGDNPFNDVEPARRAGYIPVWIRTTGSWVADELPMPRLCADTIAELPSLILREGLL